MKNPLKIQNRQIGSEELTTIRELINSNPNWHRTRISQELCRKWDWRNARGQLKDIAARSLLRKLDHRGLILLPAPVRSANNEFRNGCEDWENLHRISISSDLSELQPLEIRPISETKDVRLFRNLLQEYHYLSYSGSVGENLKYLFFDKRKNILGCILYGAAAWALADRDRFIGWNEEQRRQGLSSVANNMRFLILPDVCVPMLASHVLGLISRRISSDWMNKYRHPIFLLETFVEKQRFEGTCYKAANWQHVGQTKGRSRTHNSGEVLVPIKSIWLYPLHRSFRKVLIRYNEPSQG